MMTRNLIKLFTIAFALLAAFTLVPNARASHLRGTSLSWAPTGTTGQVTFTLQYSQRTSAGGCSVSSCAVGSTINVPVTFGDGSSGNIVATVTSVNSAQDWFAATGTITHTYSGNGPYTAYYDVCCRISTLITGLNDDLRMETTVVPNGGSPSPVVSMPAIISVPLQNTTGFAVSASDLDRDTLSYRLSTGAEMYDLTFGCTANQPPGLSINSSTGQVTWDTTQITKAGCGYAAPKAGDLWPMQIMVQDLSSTGTVKSKVPLDVILEFVSSTEPVPTLSFSNTSFTVKPGTPVSFTATGADPGATNPRVTLTATGLPLGATVTNLNSSLTPPVTSTFSWTPSVAQAGTSYSVTYTATNDTFEQVFGSVTIYVQSILPPTLTCATSISTGAGTPTTIPLTVLDPQGDAVTVQWQIDGTTVQTDNLPATTSSTSDPYVYTFASGSHTVVIRATNSQSQISACTVPVTATQQSQTINFTQPTSPVTYGQVSGVSLVASGGASGNPVVFSVLSGPGTISGNTLTITGAGSIVIAANQAAGSGYTAAPQVTRTLTVSPEAVTVTASSASMVYGGTVPSITASVSDPTAQLGAVACSTTATSTSGIGSYPTVCNVTPNSNYNVTLVNGTLTVTPAAKAITFPVLTSPVVVNSVAALSASTSDGSPVLYSIIAGGGTLSGAGITFDTTGTVTIAADSPAFGNYLAAPTVTQTITVGPDPYAYSVVPTAVGTTSATQIAWVNFTAPSTLGTIAVVTQGATGLDFNAAAGGTCTVGAAYKAGQACSVAYTFTPTSAGTRQGAVVLTGPSGNVLGTSYLSGVGNGPLGLFTSTQQTLSVGGLSTPRGLSTDGFGNVYVLETTNGNVDKIAPGTSATSVLQTLPSTGSGGTAIDGAGNLFVNSTNDQTIYEFVGGNAPANAIASTCGGDDNLEVDSAGNLYFSCYYGNSGEIDQVNAVTHAVTTLFPGNQGHRFIGIASDPAGNLFLPDFNTNTLYELPAGATQLTTLVSNDGNLSNPHGIALDPAGNIYVTNYSGNSSNVIRYAAGTLAFTLLPASGSRSIVLDGAGNLYTVLNDDSTVVAFSRTSPAPLTFPSIPFGTTVDSGQGIEFENDGNAPLVVTGYSATPNFALTGAANTCAVGPLASGASCYVGAVFAPTAVGALTGTATITDNTRGLAGTAQTIGLAGVATQQTPTVTVAPATAPYQTATTLLTATVSYQGSTAPTGSVTFTVTSEGNSAIVVASCSGATSPLTCSASYPTGSFPVTTETVVATLAADTNFTSATGTGVLGITPIAPVITFAIPSHTYGDGVVTLNATSTSNGALSYSVVSGPASIAGNTLTITGAGSVVVQASQVADNNHLTGTQNATFTVAPATLTITASSAAMTYGGTVPAITPAYVGLVNGDTASMLGVVTCSTTATSTGGAGNYPSTCSGAADANYSISYVAGSVTVKPAQLTVTASSASMTYGGTVPTITAAVAGLVNGDIATTLGTVTCSTTATGASAVGSYPTTCSGAVNPNYSISYVAGTVTVQSAALTITASNGTMVYGGQVPVITPIFTGFVNGDVPAALGVVSCSTTANAASTVGSYPSTCVGAADANYSISYVAGSVTVKPAQLTITASSASMTYGGTVPTITAAFAGLLNGDTATTLGAVSCSTTATGTSAVGGYPSTCAGAVNTNYSISYVAGAVTVQSAALTITATNGTMVYATQAPVITPIFAGFVNGDGPMALGAVTCSTTANAASTVGSYPSTCVGAADANYSISYVAGSVTVTPGTPTITWIAPVSITYGTALSATQLNASSPIAGSFAYTPASGTVLGAGTYLLKTAFTPTDKADYLGATSSVSLTVNKAVPTILWATPAAITYGTALTASQLNATASVAGTFSYSSVLGTVLKPGPQMLTVTFTPTDGADYTPATATVVLTVNRANPVITWATPAAINYGTLLSATQLNATANVAGAFSYSPAAGALLTGGVQTLTVTFTPTDTVDYTTQTKSVSLQVNETTVTSGISSGTYSYQTWINVVMGPSWSGNYSTSHVPTGTVTLLDDGVALDTLPLGSNGLAYWTINPPLNVGVHNLTVYYSGDKNYPAGLSVPAVITISPAQVNFQATCYNGTLYNSNPWQCTVSLSASTTTVPTGVITYSLDGGSPVIVAINNGNAPFTVPGTLSAGNHTLLISYAAQGNYAAAGPLTRTVSTAQGTTQMNVAPSSYYFAASGSMTISGSITTSNSGVPQGSVTIFDGGTAIGTAPIGAQGGISYTVTGVSKGSHTYSAKFAGTSNYTASTSGSATVTAY